MSQLKFLDPYKERKYAEIRGSKKDRPFKVEFSEGKFYKVDNGYVLMAGCDSLVGVIKAFKPEEGLPYPIGNVLIPIYDKDYEVWNSKEKKNDILSPTIHEKNLCAHLDLTIEEDKYYRGFISLLPDEQLTNLTDADISNLITSNCDLKEVTPSGNLLSYEAKSNGTYKKGGSYKLSPEEKIKAIKKELCNSITGNGFNDEMSLIDLVDQIVSESEDENTLAIYVDLLKTAVS